VELPPKPGIHPRRDAFIHAMPAYLREDDVAALKWVSGYPENKRRGLPYISGLIVLNDPGTGLPLAVMDAAEITAARTAAASGVCIRRWAPAGWREAAILGCGEQGRYHARVLQALEPAARIRAFDPSPERAARVGEPTSTWQEAVAGAEVVVTAGPIVEAADSPLGAEHLGGRWLGLPLDFDFYFGRTAIAAAELFLVDDLDQFESFRRAGHFADWPAPAASVGDALREDAPAGRAAPQRVACVNLGIGALDAAFGKHVLDAARERGAGTELAR
jgi:alanine dehydrogenase